MANIEYQSNSHLAITDQNNVYLDVYEPRAIPITGDEFEYTLQYKHRYRPDLLSYELYKTSKFWWVFKIANPDKIDHPIWDFKEGLVLTIPGKSAINEFGNIEFKDNVLNAYQSYTYHLTLAMINPENVDAYMDDSGAIKAEEQIVVAQSGTTTLLNIDNLDIQAVMAFSGGARDALGVRGQFVLSEPITFNLYRYLWSSLQSLNIKGSLSQARYILTVRFMNSTGEDNFFYNDTKAAVYSWPIMISTIDSTYGSAGEGSQHICNFVELGFADLQDNLKLLKGIQIENCKTFGEAILALEKKLYDQEFDDVQSATPSKGVTDVFKITINYPALAESKWIAEKYEKYVSKPP